MEQLNEHIEEKQVKWGGLLNEFLWTCAGVNKTILRQCPTEYAKYAGIGGTILFTALMAMLSGGYAFYTIFEHTLTACLFGVFWGLLIFNLDRFMVNTMYSDGKHTISRDEFLGGLPRLVLAIFLGVVISVPIELRIFDDKIQSQLLIDQGKVSEEVNKANEELYNERAEIEAKIHTYEGKLDELGAGISTGFSSRLAQLEEDLQEAENKLYEEVYGTGITGKRGYGPAAKLLQEQVDRLKGEIADLKNAENAAKQENKTYMQQQITQTNSTIAELNRQLGVVNEQIAHKEKEKEKATEALDGFTARLRAMSTITSPKNKENVPLFIARLMIMLLFIAIEIIPTLFKMMMTAGPYDNMLRAAMHRAKVLSDKRISDINDEINTEIQISTQKNQNRLEAEIKANQEVLDRIALAQAELLQVAIDAWRAEELAKIRANPSAYIRTNMSEAEQSEATEATEVTEA